MTLTREQFSNHKISLADKYAKWLIWSIKPTDVTAKIQVYIQTIYSHFRLFAVQVWEKVLQCQIMFHVLADDKHLNS